MNDWNFLVREVGRGRGVQERSLEIAEEIHRGWKKVMETGRRVAFAVIYFDSNRYIVYDFICMQAVNSTLTFALLPRFRSITGFCVLNGHFS